MQVRKIMPQQFVVPKLNQSFKFLENNFNFEYIHKIRAEVIEFLDFNNTSKLEIDNISLALTEIISNLIEHPFKKMSYLEIDFSLYEDSIKMDIKDNSSSFAKFNAKCKRAINLVNTNVNKTGGGYGLGIVLNISNDPTYVSMEESNDDLNHFTTTYTNKENKFLVEDTKRSNIFLIDDEPIVLEIHSKMLSKKYNVISFEKAQDALENFTKYKPDLIISDLVMPEMDGIELRKKLSDIEGGNITPFIFLSGNSNAENNIYMSDVGIDDFLCKPISEERLHIVVARLLKRSQQIHDSINGTFHHDIKDLLTPSLPEKSHGWGFITKYQIAEAGGGDFILNKETKDNSIIILADVMGHGKQAKFFAYTYAGYLRSMFRTGADKHNASEFLQYLSNSIDGDPLLESIILTCQCFQVFYDGIINIASAGHPLPILIKEKAARAIDIRGPLPGLIGDSQYEMMSISLNHGDKILFMTDGFLDVFDQQGLAIEKLIEIINKKITLSKEELSEYLWGEFLESQEKATINKDDATIVIIEYGV